MNNQIKTAIIFICASIYDGKEYHTIYDITRRKYYNYKIVTDGHQYLLDDYSQKICIIGNANCCMDKKTGNIFPIRRCDNRFMIADRKSMSTFNIEIKENHITSYDVNRKYYCRYLIV